MASEEQLEEIEVLQSIYPDELQLLTPTSFRIKLLLDPPPLPGASADSIETEPIILLHVSYPPTYPSVAPDLDVTLDEGSPSSWLEFPEDKGVLLDAVRETIEENLGMAMVFTLTSTLKEAAENLILERATKQDKAREDQLRLEEEKEMEKFRGELVTSERFIEWRDRFKREAEEAKRKIVEDEEAEGKRGQKANIKVEEKKLTGKELWERGLAGNADEEEEEGEETVDIAKLKLSN
ncbi:ubiquitin-conjugating enzyme/RWD-like protein [Tricharina praecox]|uniref:ubiquitin-conjugating enzyme/RWD-like protein n=1 Tax=Tricharina praecox TaxID=43433 RepID=UPI00221F94B5|nr:ubiquitin-conjugating enzyme/RWD-like protein [Tricharina praecox]KAI5855683.1 ubiquitin-conjugating enzyme/RWD-like protein [Tricharina praecox]